MLLSSGQILSSHYRIEAEIGRGAYGRVYRARDTKLDRAVAIKELARHVDDLGSSVFSDYVRRFEREARVQAGFNHPNIIHVYELIQESPDRLYLVMELVDGESLRDVVARCGPLPVDEAVRITADILAGLAAVHADPRDIVHRDIKPSNVLLTKGGQAKLADFGLAQVGDESMRSGAGQPHPGTAFYMSPEQSTTSDYLYPASDIFSVGCVLFEMLTGVTYKRAKRERKELAELRPDAPQWLNEIVAAALAKDPDHRPEDGAEMGRLVGQGQRIEADKRMAEERAQRIEADKRRAEEAERARLAEQERQRRELEEQARIAAEQEAQAAASQRAAETAERRRQAEAAERARREAERKALAEAEAVQRAKRDQEQREAAERARREAEARAAARRKAALWIFGAAAALIVALAIWRPWAGGARPETAPAQASAWTQTPPWTKGPEPTAVTPAALAVTPIHATADTRSIVAAPAADGSRPLAQISPQERNDLFSGPSARVIKSNVIYAATIVTDKGNITAELYQDTPEGVNNFVTLAQNGFYDGLTFHRVEPGFVIQGGDPTGKGSGGPGYTIPAEIHHQHAKGVLAWARMGDEVNPERRSNGSQFYITLDETPFLDGSYSVFGQVIEGMDVAEKIAAGDKIQRINISEAAASHIPLPESTPSPYSPTVQEGRPLAQKPLAERENIYNAAPAMTIDPNKSYQAIIETAKGEIVIVLDAKNAPLTVNNFVLLSDLGFYDGMPIAYPEANTLLVSGSPGKDSQSHVGYTLAVEPAANATQVFTGTVAMFPTTDPTTGNPAASGSQFFIAFTALPEVSMPLNIFGTVSEGWEVIGKLMTDDLISKITITVR